MDEGVTNAQKSYLEKWIDEVYMYEKKKNTRASHSIYFTNHSGRGREVTPVKFHFSPTTSDKMGRKWTKYTLIYII